MVSVACCWYHRFGDVHITCVHIILVVEWPPLGKELPTRLTTCSLCILTVCNFSYFPFWFSELKLGSDSVSS